MKTGRKLQKTQSNCDHDRRNTSVVFGMQRRVCEVCGHVSINLLGDSVTRGRIPLPRYEVDTQ